VTTGLSASRKTPGIYLAVILGGAGTSSGDAPKTILLQGNAVLSARAATLNLLASPQIAITAGTMAAATPTFCASADDAGTYAARGSELHSMAEAVFAQYPDATVYLEAVADGGGTAASLVNTFATNASAAFTIRIYACGKIIDVPVASGDTPTVIATACAEAINDVDTLPFTAQFSAGALTLTAKHTGPRGNALTCAFSFISASGTGDGHHHVEHVERRGHHGHPLRRHAGVGRVLLLERRDAGLVGQRHRGHREHEVRPHHRVVHRRDEHRPARGAPRQPRAGDLAEAEQGIVGSVAAYATAITLATGRNKSRLQIVWHYNSRIPPWVVAAQVGAARLIGDSAAGGRLVGEATDPAANLDGLELVSVTAQSTVADQPTATEIEGALNNGLTPLAPSANRPGFVTVARCITSRSLASGVPNYAVLDTSNVTICDHVADGLNASLATTYAGFKLTSDSSDGLPPRAPNVTSPALIRSEIARILTGYEEQAIIKDVTANLALLTVTASATPGRVDCEIPCEPMPGLHVLGGDVRQLS
jgi:phage tail sheath gpL-like